MPGIRDESISQVSAPATKPRGNHLFRILSLTYFETLWRLFGALPEHLHHAPRRSVDDKDDGSVNNQDCIWPIREAVVIELDRGWNLIAHRIRPGVRSRWRREREICLFLGISDATRRCRNE